MDRSLESERIVIREKSAEQHALSILRNGESGSLWSILAAGHFLRYSDHSLGDPIQAYEGLLRSAVEEIKQRAGEEGYYVLIKAAHQWVRENFKYQASSLSAVQMLQKKTFRCATASDFLMAVLEELGISDIFALYSFDHKQMGVMDHHNEIFTVLDANFGEPMHLGEVESEYIRKNQATVPLSVVKRRKLISLAALLKENEDSLNKNEAAELDEIIVRLKSEDEPVQMGEKPDSINDAIYKWFHTQVMTTLLPRSLDEDSHSRKIFDPKNRWSGLQADLLSAIHPSNAPMAGRLRRVVPYGVFWLVMVGVTRLFSVQEPTAEEKEVIEGVINACESKPEVIWIDLKTINLEEPFVMPLGPTATSKNTWDLFEDTDFRTLDRSLFNWEEITFYPNLVEENKASKATTIEVAFSYAKDVLMDGAGLLTPFIIALNTERPYLVYKLESGESALSIEEAERFTPFDVECLVALDAEGKVVDVEKSLDSQER